MEYIEIMDAWNPSTYPNQLIELLNNHTELVREYHQMEKVLMDEHLNSSPYQSLKPNPFSSSYLSFKEHDLMPVVANCRIRVWHYSKLTDIEIESIQKKLVLSSLDFLKQRLNNLIVAKQLTTEEAELVYLNSPLHSQNEIRADRLWTTVIPLSPNDSGVTPLLKYWGGESTYFRLPESECKKKLKAIGASRILEIETTLHDNHNAYSVSETVALAWAKSLNCPINLTGIDLAIKNCISTAKVIRVHSEGTSSFNNVATTYPENVKLLLR